MKSSQKCAAAIGIGILAGGVWACGTSKTIEETTKIQVNNGLVKYLESQKYVILEMPSSLETAGALIVINKVGGKKSVDWKTDLVRCGLSAETIWGKTKDQQEQLKNVKFPSFVTEGKNDFGIDIIAAYKGISGSVDAGTKRKQVVTVEKAGKEVVDKVAVFEQLTDPAKRASISSSCLSLIDSKKVAVITEAAFVEKGKIEYFRDDGLTVKLNKSEIIKAFDLGADLAAKVSADGTMTIDDRLFVAVKEAYYVPEFGTLGPSKQVKLDSAMADLR